MTARSLSSPLPWMALTGLLALVPVLNNLYPAAFYPSLSPFLVELGSVLLGAGAAAMGFRRFWDRMVQRERARSLVLQAAQMRNPPEVQVEEEAALAGRSIARLTRNVDEDLREIAPDFTLDSLRRLPKLLPLLREEVGDEGEARIRLGVVGAYLGETLCRNLDYRWHFRADPALRRFSYLSSFVQKEGKTLDPFDWAARLLAGRSRIGELLKEAS